jgi:uncharacterized protein YbaR (Trm112 family)
VEEVIDLLHLLSNQGERTMPIRSDLVEILACPKCKGTLQQVDKPEGFGCAACNLFYKVEDDIPDFLIEEATPWKK